LRGIMFIQRLLTQHSIARGMNSFKRAV